jgi:PRTRC genetic system protein E
MDEDAAVKPQASTRRIVLYPTEHLTEIPMFQQLVPLLRQRSVLLTVTLVEDDQVRVNVMPKKLADSENTALTTPMSFTGSAAELDEQLPAAISSFVASHLQLKNTLEKAKEEMASAAKAAQEEARNKAKNVKKPGTETTKKAEPPAKEEPKKEERPPRIVGLFDRPTEASAMDTGAAQSTAENPSQASKASATNGQSEEEEEILAEIAEDDSEESAASQSNDH